MQPGPLPDWKAPHLEPERLHVVECLPSDHLSRYRTELFLLGHRVELCGNLGDGVNQAADISWLATSISSRNVTPRTILGN